MKKRKVIWSQTAKESLKQHFEYIKNDSHVAAKKVKSEIIDASKSLASNPDQYQIDEFYPENPGNIRRYFRWSYRIVYQVNNETIDILNVLHTSQEPFE